MRYQNDLINILIVLFVFLFVLPLTTFGEETINLFDLDLEDLMNIEVISASKHKQDISQSPNAISVITAEDIRRSGSVTLPDVLRMTPGIDIMSVYGNVYGASTRGFSERLNARMLVLIDGRSIYSTLFGGVFWENEEVFLEDIERIEIIRGPGGTLYGANAATGVINIITKEPDAESGVLFSQKFGTERFSESIVRLNSGKKNGLSISLTAGYHGFNGTRGTNDSSRVSKVTTRAKYEISKNTSLHVFLGMNDSDIGLEKSSYTAQVDGITRSNHQMLRLEHRFSNDSKGMVQIYRREFALHTEDKDIIDEDAYNVEMQYAFRPVKTHRVTLGLNYRTTGADVSFTLPKEDHDNIIGFFFQDEIRIFDTLQMVTGIKYENNSITDGDFSPRICFLYTPWKQHHFRFSISRAYRTPGFAEINLFKEETLAPPNPPIVVARIIGDKNLKAERMTAYELGYRTKIARKINFNAELKKA